MRKMKVALVFLDKELHPRNNVDDNNVRGIVEAMQAGVELPPIIIDRKTKTCIDGFHRVKAVIKFLGADAEIDVIEKVYRTEAEMFLDAMRLNAHHGARLDSCDRTRCTLIAGRLNIPLESVAGALNMPIEKLGHLHDTRTATSAGLTIPLKRTIARQFHGKVLTKRQAQANTKLSGMNQVFYVNQVIELIEAKMLDMEDENLLIRVRLLHELIDGLLVA